MGKISSRAVVSQSKPEEPGVPLNIFYCLCGEFLLVLQGSLAVLPRRPTDGAYALRNEGDKQRVYKLNSVGGPGREGGGVVVRLGKDQFEFQRRLHCPRCLLCIGYETKPGSQKGPATFILPGSMTETQNELPADAFGDEFDDEPPIEKEPAAGAAAAGQAISA
ncbi:hypothetical protein RQP46_011420 [Phenoliferia psychrophenolica]